MIWHGKMWNTPSICSGRLSAVLKPLSSVVYLQMAPGNLNLPADQPYSRSRVKDASHYMLLYGDTLLPGLQPLWSASLYCTFPRTYYFEFREIGWIQTVTGRQFRTGILPSPCSPLANRALNWLNRSLIFGCVYREDLPKYPTKHFDWRDHPTTKDLPPDHAQTYWIAQRTRILYSRSSWNYWLVAAIYLAFSRPIARKQNLWPMKG
jgi:hypothetical protein